MRGTQEAQDGRCPALVVQTLPSCASSASLVLFSLLHFNMNAHQLAQLYFVGVIAFEFKTPECSGVLGFVFVVYPVKKDHWVF